MSDQIFFFGDWQVNPESNSVRCNDTVRTLEPKAMDALLFLCRKDGHVVSAEDILDQCWSGAELGDNPIHKVITQLRKALGDEASAPRYIETIRKRGYRTLAQVVFPVGHEKVSNERPWLNGSPFPGLRAFEQRDAAVFFGRGDHITTLLQAITTQARRGYGLNIVLGPSGSGKTSLVNAGIIPNLSAEHGFDGLRVCTSTSVDMADVGEQRLFLDLASALLDWEVADEPVFTNISAEVLAQELQTHLDKLVQLFASIMAEKAGQNRYQLLLMDRLEVLLSAPQFSQAARLQVIRIMEKFAASGAAIVLATCRNDFYPTLAQHPALMKIKATGGHFDLLPPSRAELLQMIRLPAAQAQLHWQSDEIDTLDQLLCDDAVGNPDALPMLQYTLNALYEQRSNANVLRLDVYRALGGIEGAIGKRAEAIVTDLPHNVSAALPNIFAKVVTLSNDEKSITSRTALWSQLRNEQEQQLVKTLVENRLFVSHLVGEAPGFSLAHEALLRKWQRAVEWIQQHRDNLKALSRLQIAAERWQNENEAKEFLLASGKPLFEAKDINSNPLFELNKNEQRFIAHSTKRSGLRKTLRRATVALLAALTLVSIVMTVRSIDSEKRAEQRREQADDLLGYMVGDFADKVRPLGRLDLLGGVSEKALEYLNTSSAISLDSRLKYALALQTFGEVEFQKGNISVANRSFTNSNRALLDLHSIARDDSNIAKALAISHYWIGKSHLDENELDKAERHFRDYAKYAEVLRSLAPKSEFGLIELGHAESNLGTLFFKKNDYTKAMLHFESALEFREEVVKYFPNSSDAISNLANTKSWLGTVLERTGNLSLAINLFIEEGLILDTLINAHPSEFKWLWRRCNSRIRVANAYLALGRGSEALPEIQIAKAQLKRLLSTDQSNIKWRSQYFYAQILYFDVLISLNSGKTKVIDFTELNNQLDSIEALKGDSGIQWLSAYFSYTKGRYDFQNKEFKTVIEKLTEANLRIRLNESSALSEKIISAKLNLLIAASSFATNNQEHAEHACSKIMDDFDSNALSESDYGALSTLSLSYACVRDLKKHLEIEERLTAIGYQAYEHKQLLIALKDYFTPRK